MNIHLSAGIGSASTKLAAFDVALNDAGIANYNLLRLSSVIPPNSTIVNHSSPLSSNELTGKWGDKLYVVMAEERSDTPGAEVWAGIGWVQEKGSNKGLFVEHEGDSEESVRSDIQKSLETLMKTRGVDFGDVQMKVVGTKCVDEPVCALVIAAYESTGWKN
jgi:arginine decarboxylase